RHELLATDEGLGIGRACELATSPVFAGNLSEPGGLETLPEIVRGHDRRQVNIRAESEEFLADRRHLTRIPLASCKTPFSGNQNGIGWSTNTNRSANPVLFCKFLPHVEKKQSRSHASSTVK